ncbi:hypothetical protein [Pseudonocardia sp. H11422]|uniref:hypothetical protein n=1 Tax=Pseudonocardia sp. H11422 TaxID=2835866 RepID=UPI001BDC255E|nr:hypothetical protein [Pseudonocardia sp. H11422]
MAGSSVGDRSVARAHRHLQTKLRRLRTLEDPRIERDADRIADEAARVLHALADRAWSKHPEGRRTQTPGDAPTSPANPQGERR